MRFGMFLTKLKGSKGIQNGCYKAPNEIHPISSLTNGSLPIMNLFEMTGMLHSCECKPLVVISAASFSHLQLVFRQ
jgi:hypothetical protein